MPDVIAKPARWCPGLRDGHPLERGLVGLWPFWEGQGDKLFDVANPYAVGNHGTLTNMDPATDWVASPRGLGLDFDGGNDFIDHGYVLSGYTAITVAVMFMRDSGQGAGLYAAVGKAAGNGWNGFYLAAFENDLRFQVDDTGGDPCYQQTGNTLATGEIILGMGTYDGVTCHTYVNGVLDDGGGSRDISSVVIPNTHKFTIGARNDGAEEFWLGSIFCVWIWNCALNATGAKELSADPWGLIKPRAKTYTYKPAAAPGVLFERTKVGTGI